MLRTELRRPPLPALALASTHSTRLASAGAGAAVALAYAGLCLLLAHPAVAPGSEGYGYTGATGLHGLLRWDGAWYAGIAEHGYALGSGRYRAIAFFPLFPALVAAAHHLLPFVSIAAAGTAINIAATVAAAVLIGECLGEWRSRDRLLAIVAILLVPSAFFDVAFYSEGLFLLASALVVWGVAHPSRIWWAAGGVTLATLDRPTGILLVVFVVLALRHVQLPPRTRAIVVATAAAGAITVMGFFWAVAGGPLAFAGAQNGWSSLRTLGAADAVRWLLVQINPFTATNPVVSFGYWELLVVAVPLLVLIRRHRAAAAYSAVALLTGFVLGGVGTQSRYLAAILPLWLTALVVLRERVPRHFATVAVAATTAGGAANLWLLSRFAAGIWAG